MFVKKEAGMLCTRYTILEQADFADSGGRDVFKWEDVKDSQHRENYLGHSLMARESLTDQPLSQMQN